MTKKPTDLRERIARAICAAVGDNWNREGPRGLMPAYGPMADAAIKEQAKDTCRVCGAPIESCELCETCASGNDPFPATSKWNEHHGR